MIGLLKKLHQIKFLSIKGIIILSKAFYKHGFNQMALLKFSSVMHPKRIAISEKQLKISYEELYRNSFLLSNHLSKILKLGKKSKVALLCRNHSICLQSLFALSRLGTDIVFLNVDMSTSQIENIISKKKFDLLIYDNEFENKTKLVSCKTLAAFNNKSKSIQELLKIEAPEKTNLKIRRAGNISVLTGGTSGKIKLAKRKPSILSIMSPFLSLLDKLELNKYRTVYISVPFYHGYGLASVSIASTLSSTIIIRPRFEINETIKLLKEEKVEIGIFVPTTLKRLMEKDASALCHIKVILSAGAPLREKLATQVLEEIGMVLFNLYGTSEAGFCVLAQPKDLLKHPNTIGKKITFVKLKILDEKEKELSNNEPGNLAIKTAWSMFSQKGQYYKTGDLAYVNDENYLFLKGRTDNMIVSGGENVYPIDIENKLLENKNIEAVQLIAIVDEDFDKVFIAFIVLRKEVSAYNTQDIRLWLSKNIARYQMPKKIILLKEFPMTSTGKVNKKALLENLKY